MKKGIFFLAVILLMAAGSFVLGQNEKKLKNWHKEEVNHIITKSEAAEFRKLKKEEDREFYTELFWAKRDPTPLTEKNEFKEEFYRRLAYVNKVISFSPGSFEGKLIQQVKSTQENIIQIPFEKKTIFTKARNNSSYLTILVKIDPIEKS